MIQPLEGYLLVDRIKDTAERDDKTKTGIYMPETALAEARDDLVVSKGKVLEVASDVDFKKGDEIYYNYFAGNTIIRRGKDPLGKDDKELFLVYKEDVLAKEVK